MKTILKENIEKVIGTNTENLDFVLEKFTTELKNKNDIILNQGESCEYVYFLCKGAVQVYVYNKDNNLVTRDILTEGSWFSDLPSFGKGIPATENIKCIESSIFYKISRNDFNTLMNLIPQFYVVYKDVLEEHYANSVLRVNTLFSLTSLERLKWLIDNKPTYLARFSSKLLASYLGMNKDVFSKLKSKI